MAKSASKSDSAYAVVRTGGKQYTVAVGKKISVEKLEGKIGDAITFSEVIATRGDNGQTNFGSPFISGAKVTGKIVGHQKDKKVITFRKKIKQGFTKKIGHRQSRTQVLIENIGV